MNVLIPIGVIVGLGALVFGKSSKASPLGAADPVFTKTLLGLLNSDTQSVNSSVNDFRQRGDAQTAGALEAELGRMQAAQVGQGASLPTVFTFAPDGLKSPALNEWGGVLISLEGRPTVLRQWAAAYAAAGMPLTAAALVGKADDTSGSQGGTSAPLPGSGAGAGSVPPIAIPPAGSTPVDVPGAGAPSQTLQQQIAQTLASGSASSMRALADVLAAQGLTAQADQLRARALEIEAAAAAASSPGIPGFPAIPPQLPLPSGPASLPSMPSLPSALPGLPDPKRMLAEATRADLIAKPSEGVVGKPSAMLRTFQTQEGLVVDGLYGPKSALAMAQNYLVVPPKPRQFNTKNKVKDSAAYNDAITKIAMTDTARSAEWLAARV